MENASRRWIPQLLAGGLVLWTTGCGTIHIGSTTHTHFFGPVVAQTDDVSTGLYARIKRIALDMHDPDIGMEPLEGFAWTEAGVEEEDLSEEQIVVVRRDGS